MRPDPARGLVLYALITATEPVPFAELRRLSGMRSPRLWWYLQRLTDAGVVAASYPHCYSLTKAAVPDPATIRACPTTQSQAPSTTAQSVESPSLENQPAPEAPSIAERSATP